MNLGPDGSLCRITSSAKDLINNVQIIKVPDGDPIYQLVLLGADEEESVEESDSELSEDEFPSKNVEDVKVADKKLDEVKKTNKAVNEEVKRGHTHRNKQRHQHNRKYFPRRTNFNRNATQYKNLLNKGVFEYGKSDFNSAFNSPDSRDFNSAFNSPDIRDFNSKAIPNLAYEVNDFQHSSFSPSPWAQPPVLLSNHPYTQFSPVNLPENPRGLLGERPLCGPSLDQASVYPPMMSNSHNSFIRGQNSSSFSQMPSNSRSNFVHNQNSSYSHRTSNYLPNEQADNFGHDKNYWNGSYNNYHKNNPFRNKHLNDNKRNRGSWNKNQRRPQNARNNSSRSKPSFDYRN